MYFSGGGGVIPIPLQGTFLHLSSYEIIGIHISNCCCLKHFYRCILASLSVSYVQIRVAYQRNGLGGLLV